MQVLLFLTALLSAMTGVAAGARADDMRVARAEERLVVAAAAIAPAAASAPCPVRPRPLLVRATALPFQASFRPAPLATIRLIE